MIFSCEKTLAKFKKIPKDKGSPVHTHIATLNVNLTFLGVWVLVFDVSSWQLDASFHNILTFHLYFSERRTEQQKLSPPALTKPLP